MEHNIINYHQLVNKQVQRRAAMDCRMNHNIRHCGFIYASHIHDIIYEGVF